MNCTLNIKHPLFALLLQPGLATVLPGGETAAPPKPNVLMIVADDLNEWNNLAGKPEFASVKTGLAKWLPKSDAPSLSKKAKRAKAGEK